MTNIGSLNLTKASNATKNVHGIPDPKITLHFWNFVVMFNHFFDNSKKEMWPLFIELEDPHSLDCDEHVTQIFG